MANRPLSDDLALEAAAALKRAGTQVAAARQLGISRSTLQARLHHAQARGFVFHTEIDAAIALERKIDTPQRQHLTVQDGMVVVFSDAHFWPGLESTAYHALLHFLRLNERRVRAVINNGDAFDGASISRHPSIGWETKPALIDEMKACQDSLDAIRAAAPNAEFIWDLGNHDARFETKLANVAPEYAKVHGVHLRDHFPHWRCAWSTWINDSVVVKHRFKSGIHAPHNNAMWAGKHIVTGHLHSMKAYPITDYNGTRWGIDAGTLAEPFGPQFVDYTEDNPVHWRSGFCVLSFHEGKLLWPEFVHVLEPGQVEFRGRVYAV